MRSVSIILSASMIALSSLCSAEPVAYVRHTNLFASIDLPGTAVQQQPDVFVMKRGGAEVPITLDASIPHYDERKTDCRPDEVTYILNQPDIFAYSCRIGSAIFYSLTKYGKTYRIGASNGTEQIGYTIRYPLIQRSYWNSVVRRMSRSLKFVR